MPSDTAAHASHSAGGDEGLAPRVLREVLRTPAFREIIRLNATAPSTEDARRAVKTLVGEEVQVTFGLASASPAAVDAAVESAAALGEYLAALPQPLLDAYLDEVLGAIDGERLRQLPPLWGPIVARALLPRLLSTLSGATEALAASLVDLKEEERAEVVRRLASTVDGHGLGRALNALSRLVIQLRAEHPDLTSDRTFASDLVRGADFGKARVAAGALSAYGREALTGFFGEALADPVALANLVMTLPPIVNDQLEVLSSVVASVELPDEVLASAALAVLGEIHVEEVGRIVSQLASVLETIHEGSRILGHRSPAFEATASELLHRLVQTLDAAAVGRALVVLGEDGESLLAVLADLVRREPALVPGLAWAILGAGAPMTRGVTTVLREVNALPEEAFSALGGHVVEQVEPAQVARLLGETLTFAARYRRANPEADLVGDVVGELRHNRELRRALEPERVGQGVTALLVRFNRYMAGSPEAEKNYLLRVVASIDPAEVEQAWHSVIGAFTGTLLESAERARAVVRPVMRVGWKTLRLVAAERRRDLLESRGRRGA